MSETETYSDEALLELFDDETVDQLEDNERNFKALRRAHRALRRDVKGKRAEVSDAHSKLRSYAVSKAGFDPDSKQGEGLIKLAAEDPDADEFDPSAYREIAEAVGMEPVTPEPEQPSQDGDTDEEYHEEE